MARPRDTKQNHERGTERSEFDQKTLDIRRTARVMAGGRRFSFRVTVALGNRNGKVGIGTGKSADVSGAMEKAAARAKKNILSVPIGKTKSIPFRTEGKISAARVLLKPAAEGHGLVAGGPVRIIAELAGVKNMTAKILGRTSNKLNNAKAVMAALKKLKETA